MAVSTAQDFTVKYTYFEIAVFVRVSNDWFTLGSEWGMDSATLQIPAHALAGKSH